MVLCTLSSALGMDACSLANSAARWDRLLELVRYYCRTDCTYWFAQRVLLCCEAHKQFGRLPVEECAYWSVQLHCYLLLHQNGLRSEIEEEGKSNRAR